MTGVRRSTEPLTLVTEAKVAELLDGVDASSLEPSGVCVHDGACYVIFDDVSAIARIEDMSQRAPGNRLLDATVGAPGQDREDITFDPVSGHFFVLVEAVEHEGRFLAEVHEHDVDGTPLGHAFLDLTLEARNKGLEGLGCIVRGGEVLLLGLCEGNRCRGGTAGRRPGGGRIHVFRRGRRRWKDVATIRLPSDLEFIDYASVAVSDDRIAVVSQSSSALWIGTLTPSGFAVEDGGTVHELPRDADGRVVYGNVEGVSWLGHDRFVMVSDRAEIDGPTRAKERALHVFALPAPAAPAAGAPTPATPVIRGLFQRRVHGDDALMRLARRRFREAGIGAEVYAHDEDDLRAALRFVPPADRLPAVHLDRKLDLSKADDVERVARFAEHFAGEVSGLVVHDQRHMAEHTDELVESLEQLDRRLAGIASCPSVFVEYAAGHPVDWFAHLGERLRACSVVGVAVDVGHIGIRHARRTFVERHPDIELTSLTAGDPRLPALVDDVVAAVASARPVLLELIVALGANDRPLHFHLHDGHPLADGLEDHRSFLMRVPIPFEHAGRWSLPPLYGPGGLAAIVTTARRACTAPLSFTLEIHEGDGRLPVHDVDDFRHWHDLTNAERMNAWLAVIADNAEMVRAALREGRGPGDQRSAL